MIPSPQLARWEQSHAERDTLLFNSAGFVWDAARGVYIVTVRGHIVAEPRSLREVRAFCEMHNNRLGESLRAEGGAS